MGRVQGQTRDWQPSWRCALGPQLLRLRRGVGDPTYRLTPEGEHWRGLRTPEGTATLALSQNVPGGWVRARAWGDGAGWALARLPRLLGDEDDPSGFEPTHPVLLRAVRLLGVPRFGRTDLVFEAVLPAVLEQKVTGQEAFAGFRDLVRAYGEPAPGAPRELRLMVPPSAEQVRSVPSWDWLGFHVDRARSATLQRAARVAPALERISGPEVTDAEQRLTSVPGIGEWTAAEVRSRALGDPDAVSFGDYHVAKDVTWALTGEALDDDALRQLLEPWRGHRGRVVALVGAAGLHRPRRGPRMAPRTHLPGPTPGTRYPGRGPSGG